MKKYIYCLVLLVVIVYSCTTQNSKPTPVVYQTIKTDDTPALVNGPETPAQIVKKGEAVFKENCGSCHRLHAPSEYTVEEWKPIMTEMAKEAELTPEQTNWIFAYVNANAKK